VTLGLTRRWNSGRYAPFREGSLRKLMVAEFIRLDGVEAQSEEQ
jgi:hypothetical protein